MKRVGLGLGGLPEMGSPVAAVTSAQGTALDCPNGGTIRFGLEPPTHHGTALTPAPVNRPSDS
jgi:hypothetical protein